MRELFSPINLMVLAAIIHYVFGYKETSELVSGPGKEINGFKDEVNSLREQAEISSDATAYPFQSDVARL